MEAIAQLLDWWQALPRTPEDLERLWGGGNSCPPAARRRSCDGHHEMSDLGAAGEPVHSGGESIKPVWPHRRRMVRAGLREKDHEQDHAQFREPRSSRKS
jgi:hypothetical protein